jgi:hypothetical protein
MWAATPRRKARALFVFMAQSQQEGIMTERKDDPMALWTGGWGRKRHISESERSSALEPGENSDETTAPKDRPEERRPRRAKTDS